MRATVLVLFLSAGCNRGLGLPVDGATADSAMVDGATADSAMVDGATADSAMVDGATADSAMTGDSSTMPGSCAKPAAPVSMPTVFFGGAAIAGADGRIYILGAQGSNGSIASQWAYAPSTGAWTQLPDPPGTMNTGGFAASVGQTIYLLGEELFAFDLATQTWSTKSAGPGGTYSAGSDGKIYATGSSSSQPPTVPERYDPASDTWTVIPVIADKTVLEDENAKEVGAFLGDTFYVIGNANVGYNIAENTWKQLAAPPIGRLFAVGGALGQRIFVAGGFPPDIADLGSPALYDPTTDSWSAAASMPTPVGFYAQGAAGCDGRFYVFGGAVLDPVTKLLNAVTRLVQVYDPATNTWESSQ